MGVNPAQVDTTALGLRVELLESSTCNDIMDVCEHTGTLMSVFQQILNRVDMSHDTLDFH